MKRFQKLWAQGAQLPGGIKLWTTLLSAGFLLAAVLSQEISAVMGVPLTIGYLLFARDKR